MGRLGDAAGIGGPERGLWTLLCTIEQRGTPTMIADLEASPAFTLVANKAYRSYALAVMAGRAGDHVAAAEYMADGDGAVTPLTWFQHHARRLIAETALTDGWGDPISWLRDAVTYFEQQGPDQLVSTCRAMLTGAGAAVPRRTRKRGHDVPTDLLAAGITAREVEVLERLAAARLHEGHRGAVVPVAEDRRAPHLEPRREVGPRRTRCARGIRCCESGQAGPLTRQWGR